MDNTVIMYQILHVIIFVVLSSTASSNIEDLRALIILCVYITNKKLQGSLIHHSYHRLYTNDPRWLFLLVSVSLSYATSYVVKHQC